MRGNAEVQQLDEVLFAGPGGEHNVVGLEVAMNNAQCVRFMQRAAHLLDDGQRPRQRDRSLLDQVGERLPVTSSITMYSTPSGVSP